MGQSWVKVTRFDPRAIIAALASETVARAMGAIRDEAARELVAAGDEGRGLASALEVATSDDGQVATLDLVSRQDAHPPSTVTGKAKKPPAPEYLGLVEANRKLQTDTLASVTRLEFGDRDHEPGAPIRRATLKFKDSAAALLGAAFDRPGEIKP